MNIKSFQVKLDKKFSASEIDKKVMKLAVLDVHDMMSQRIFEEGKNISGKRFKYKSKSYIALKKKKGINTSFVNFRLTADLQRDFNNANRGVKERKKGVLNYVISVKRQRNIELVNKLNEKYKKPFAISADERRFFKKSIEINLALLIK